MKTIFDLLTIDLKSLPNANCIETAKRTNSSGDQLTEYTLVLDKPELGLFTLANIIQFTSGNKNIVLSNFNLESIKIPHLEKLVNSLFSIYGNDLQTPPLGVFTARDHLSVRSFIADPVNGYWEGRLWNSISIYLDDEKLGLTIHGVPSYQTP